MTPKPVLPPCRRARAARLALLLGCLLAALASVAPAAGQAGGTTIAYISTATLDEIRLIDPDGGNDRRLWAGPPDPQGAHAISALAWRPDGGELAFSSTHENGCSLYDQDLFAIRPDGAGYRRITNAPACAGLAGRPTGSVRVRARNSTAEPRTIHVYVQGAPGPRQLSLAPFGSAELVFDGVADLGAMPQLAVGILSYYRWMSDGGVDVQPGRLVDMPPLTIGRPSAIFAAHQPSWRADRSRLAFTFGRGLFYQVAADPGWGHGGAPLLASSAGMPTVTGRPSYAPTAARAGQLLYYGEQGGWGAIYLLREGGAGPGEALVRGEWNEYIHQGLAWLPDGSGFIYAKSAFGGGSSGLYEYSFAAGGSRPIASFDDYAHAPSVSPDGRQIVFMRAGGSHIQINDPDAWVIGRDGGGLRLLARDALFPAWSPPLAAAPGPSPQPTPAPPERLTERLHLPLLSR